MCAHPQGQEAAEAATSPPSRPSTMVQAGDRHGRSSVSTGQDSDKEQSFGIPLWPAHHVGFQCEGAGECG